MYTARSDGLSARKSTCSYVICREQCIILYMNHNEEQSGHYLEPFEAGKVAEVLVKLPTQKIYQKC